MSVQPIVVVLAGPNGAGKSTTAPALLQGALGVTEFVDADVIAGGLSAFNAEGAAIAAGRVMLARLKTLARQRVSFAFETTLASRSFAPWLAELKATGYAVHSGKEPRLIAHQIDLERIQVYDRQCWDLITRQNPS